MHLDIKDLLDRLQTRDECHQIEAKEAKSHLGNSVLHTISSFSNEPGMGGGYLLLGLKKNDLLDEDNRYVIQGVDSPDEIQQQLTNVCRNSFNIQISPEIKVEVIQDKILVFAYIPESFPRDKPVFIKKLGLDKGSYRRIGSSDCLCTSNDIDFLFQLRSGFPYENEILRYSEWLDLDVDAIEEYRKLRREIDPTAREIKLDDKELLLALGCAAKKEGKILPTVAGLLLFGTKATLRRLLPTDSRVDYIMVEGSTWVGNPSSRYHTIDFREALIYLMPRLSAQIIGDIPTRFSLKNGDLQRSDIPSIPREVIREAVANALMHRDYRAGQPTQVIRYSNRLEFRNAGYSLKPFEELGEPGSKQRNLCIANVFHELKYAETKGTGIRAMREKMVEAGLSAPPIIETDRDRNEFDLILLPHHLLDREGLEWLSNFKKFNLSDAQRRALVFVWEVGAITNEDYRQLNGTDTLSASVALRGLRDLELLTQKGKGNATYYVLGPKVTEKVAPKTTPDISPITPDISPITPDISPITPDIFSNVSNDLIEELKCIGKRTSVKKIKDIISKLCAIQPFTLQELVKLTQRDSEHLRNRYLSKMIKDKELEYVYPDNPNHPQQAYRTVGRS